MDPKELLRRYKEGRISEEDLIHNLKLDHIQALEDKLRYDLCREARSGFPEAVLGLSKTAEDVSSILRVVMTQKDVIFVTKLDPDKMQAIRQILSAKKGLMKEIDLEYHADPRLLVVRRGKVRVAPLGCCVGIVAGGTSDVPVAEEARVTCEESGLKTVPAYDVGVAGLHRLLAPLRRMLEEDVDVFIVVAGMEGALPSVVKGLVDVPVIGVPTSIGYGYRSGESALIAMLNSCVPGLVVANIDNGFGAAAAAYLICLRISRQRAKER